MTDKIQVHHKEKLAYVYLRQSTMGQVRLNRESTERQYALADKAKSLGWQQQKIKILDNDLGLSGADSSKREDFKSLIADVSLGKVGAVLALEASRLSRSCTDWHRLLEICALTETLIIDEDGCYNPSDFNDQLLLGLKGTMSQAELHFIRARLLGGKINKAKKGQLRFPLPVGYCYDSQGHTVLDHDEQVREVIALLFKIFHEQGSAYAVSHYFGKNNLLFPKRAYGGVWKDTLVWGKLTLSRVLGVLKNPSYAGVYVYGRFHYNKTLSLDGKINAKMVKLPQDRWPVVIQEHHVGYITWDNYMENQKRLENNQTNGKEILLPGPAREGLALLHGLLICSYCGHKITVRYQGNGGIAPYYLCSSRRRDGSGTKDCLAIQCAPADQAIAERVLAVIEPQQIQIAIQALEELEIRQQSISKQWQLKLQRAQYEADLAQRRYEEVDPSNRLVAATLEKRWNDSLVELDTIQRQFDEQMNNNKLFNMSSKKEELFKLSKDFPKLWHSDSTNHKDRKRILRLLIKDITVKVSNIPKQAILYIRWQGGATEEMYVALPLKSSDKWRCTPEVVAQVREMAITMSDEEIVKQFNSAGKKTAKGNTYTVCSIQWIRYKHRIPSCNFRKPDELSINEVAQKFDISHHVVRYWIERGILPARKANNNKFWVTLSPEKQEELREKVIKSTKISLVKAKNSKTKTEGVNSDQNPRKYSEASTLHT